MIPEAALDLIKQYEGFRSAAYQDPVGIWTIGYGTTRGVKKGDHCSLEEAEGWLKTDAQEAADDVLRLAKVPLNANQLGALTSWVYNLGAHRLEGSTLLRKLNAGDYQGAHDQFNHWIYAGGMPLPGLEKRREAEAKLFNTPDFSNVQAGVTTT